MANSADCEQARHHGCDDKAQTILVQLSASKACRFSVMNPCTDHTVQASRIFATFRRKGGLISRAMVFFIVLPRSSTQWADCAFILHSCRDLSPNDRKQGRSKAMERGLESPKSPAKVEGGGGCRDVPGAAEGEHQTPTKEEGDQRSVTYRLESKGERECRSKGT